MTGYRVTGVRVRKGGETITLKFRRELQDFELDVRTEDADLLVACVTQGAGAAYQVLAALGDRDAAVHARHVQGWTCRRLPTGEVFLQLRLADAFGMNFLLNAEQVSPLAADLLSPPGAASFPRHN